MRINNVSFRFVSIIDYINKSEANKKYCVYVNKSERSKKMLRIRRVAVLRSDMLDGLTLNLPSVLSIH